MHALAKNCTKNILANNGTVAMVGAKDVCFIFAGASAVKFQGSNDGGSTYADIAGSNIVPAADGVVDADVIIVSFTEVRFDHMKVVATTTGDFVCFCIQTGIRDVVRAVGVTTFVQPGTPGASAPAGLVNSGASYSIENYVNATQKQMNDPVLGTYNDTTLNSYV